MKKILIVSLLLAIWLFCLPSSTEADCCHATKIRFELSEEGRKGGRTCANFGAKGSGHNPCELKICNNGNNIVGTYCGQGTCDPLGCHCRHGCLLGDPIPSFKAKHGAEKFVWVRYA